MPTIKSKKTGEVLPVSDATWGRYGEQGLQQNFQVVKKDTAPPEVAEEKTTVVSASPKKIAATSRTSNSDTAE